MAKTATRYLSERQAWLRIAEAYGVDELGQFSDEHLTRTGLCRAISKLRNAERVTHETFVAMHQRLSLHRPFGAIGYWWPLNHTGAFARIAFCRRMARLCAPKPARAHTRKAPLKKSSRRTKGVR